MKKTEQIIILYTFYIVVGVIHAVILAEEDQITFA